MAAVLIRTCFMEMAGKSEDSEDEEEERLRVALEELATSEVEPKWQWLKDAADALTREYRSRRIKRVWYPGKGGGLRAAGVPPSA